MRFIIGSKNPIKIKAVTDLVFEFPCLQEKSIESIDVESGVDAQPMCMEDIVKGALNRAYNCSKDDSNIVGIGIESGLHLFPVAGWMDVAACVISQGKGKWIGLSSAFRIPDDIMKYVYQDYDLGEASKLAGYTNKDKLGSSEGLIGVLSRGRMPRVEQAKQAVRQALYEFERNYI